ncbi:MAG: hypothetical protein MRERV_46c013 [Mycoplasmataceae bacterium RV_VA103A]|nr:MAG: hypothetical protein MRERV_46c013 [Mycoplasmataceae bacterium RV_VA103A]
MIKMTHRWKTKYNFVEALVGYYQYASQKRFWLADISVLCA